MTNSYQPQQAKWIWIDSDNHRPFHHVACFRRIFELAPGFNSGCLHITADTRYEVFINGQWIGGGPSRAWPSEWPVDTFVLEGILHPGQNVISVRVQHHGLGNFQYIHRPAGVLAELSWVSDHGTELLGTNDQWLGILDPGYLWPVPRINCQLGWEEQYDARVGLNNWQQIDFDDSDWPFARVLQGDELPHSDLYLSTIPQLTRDVVFPQRVLPPKAVSSAQYIWNLNPRGMLHPDDKEANVLRGDLLLSSQIYSPCAQQIEIQQPHSRPRLIWKLNGESIPFDETPDSLIRTSVYLNEGWNSLMVKMPAAEQYWWAVLNVWSPNELHWSAHSHDRSSSQWLSIGPFGDLHEPHAPPIGSDQIVTNPFNICSEATMAKHDSIWGRGSLSERELSAEYVQPLSQDMVSTNDVYAHCASERIIQDLCPKTFNLATILNNNDEWASIDPFPDVDVRILIDLGREHVGYVEFEVDSAADTILDFHFFENMNADGEVHLMSEMNNTFRYICRAGVQTYRSLLRRGFRYCWLSIRQQICPLRLRGVRLISSTYPQANKGSFSCSDELLNNIWKVGAHTLACCSEDTYTDCPGYEQTFWVGDGRNEALVDFVVNGDPRLSAHCWNLAAKSLDRSELVESQVPSAWQSLLPAWSFLWMRWAEEHFRYTGDEKLGRFMLTQLARNVAGIRNNLSSRGLFKIRASSMFDWAPMDTPADGEITHLNALAVLGLRQAATLAEELGEYQQCQDWHDLADGLVVAINRHLWSPEEGAFVDCIRANGELSSVFSQQTQTAVYIANSATTDRLAQCRKLMQDAPPHFVKGGSPFFMFFVLEGMAREQDSDSLVQLIRSYWGKQIHAGATTFWEQFFPDQSRMTRSYCHGWSTAPTYFLSQRILGIQPSKPGFEEVLVSPKTADLKWARGSMPTPRGAIHIDWRIDEPLSCFVLELLCPTDMSVLLELPVSGPVVITCGEAEQLDSNAGKLRFHCCQGSKYSFRVQLETLNINKREAVRC
ncbi:family 78 glycoside hydrolase catalytic domain [Coraliomargarita sp. SDUM461004]|uniref:Family 78 glycoside hydrolase catalytic domain n=1 Tax=Thalassobacterium sedimentorum TaxID=3041258 RepID=A0ABU1AM10_9BACT|nr:family 78 glycoside hydrolase catalytic domain [Coraliomargarita sp. SDUM461004]MDQ8195709.1 family 78 glycoside hydrolase catalytic domain [Coraliomargarita sp. SDUM461004]